MLLKFHSNKDNNLLLFFTNYNAILNAWTSFNNSGKKANYAQRYRADGGIIKNYTKNPKEKELYSGAARINLIEETVTEIDGN